MAKTLTAEIREAKNPREMRRTGSIPGVVYGRGFHKEIAVKTRDLEKLMGSMTRSSRVDLKVDGESHGVFIKDIQYHPLTDKVLHIDFFRPESDQIVKMEIPVKFFGEPRGRRRGGAVSKVREFVELKGSPEFIPEIFELDIADLDVGSRIRAGDLELPENTELVTTPDVLLLQVIIPRRVKAEGDEEDEDVEAEAGEAASEATAESSEGESAESSADSEEA